MELEYLRCYIRPLAPFGVTLYIIATPYVVDSGKSIIESLQDPKSKLSKLNQMTDKALDKALMYLGENENDKQNKN